MNPRSSFHPRSSHSAIEILEARVAPAKLIGVDAANNLVQFDSAAPGTLTGSVAITGLQAGESIVALDFRPETGELYGLGSGSRLYQLNPLNGTATQIGTDGAFTLLGSSFGFEFSPTADRIRVVSNSDQNIRLNPVTGALAAADADVAYAAGDSHFGQNPEINGLANTNNFGGAKTTTLFAIDTTLDILARIGGPDGAPSSNTGQLTTVGPLGVNITATLGFDILADGTALAAVQVVGFVTSSLYSIDLATGAATLIGNIGGGAIRGLTAIPSIDVKLVNATTATYLDVDGDRVTIKVSKGTLETSDFRLFPRGGPGRGQLQLVNFSDDGAEFDGANLTFSVAKKAGGDGLAHVGYINATGVDLGRVVVKGDLGRIVAGDAVTTDDPGLALLQARSVGLYGVATQGQAGSVLNSVITGKLGALKVAGDFKEAYLQVTGGVNGQIGSISIGGDILGGSAVNSGLILSSGKAGPIRIGGDIVGSTGAQSGQISVGDCPGIRVGGDIVGGSASSTGQVRLGDVGIISVGGSVIGGAGVFSGRISAGHIESARIAGDLIGGAGGSCGQVVSGETIVKLQIGGSVIGGASGGSGTIGATNLESVRIGGDLVGGSAVGGAIIYGSGDVLATQIGSVTIRGSIIAGTADPGSYIHRGGSITAFDSIGAITVGGNLWGNASTPVYIVAEGQTVKPATGFDVAIAKVSVAGEVRNTRILAGFTQTFDGMKVIFGPGNADASIGTVTVGRDWSASSIVAGAEDTGAAGFGSGDRLQVVGDTALVARIASIVLKKTVSGSAPLGDNFGFVAQQIDQFRAGSRVYSLNPGPTDFADNILLPITDDVHVLEV